MTTGDVLKLGKGLAFVIRNSWLTAPPPANHFLGRSHLEISKRFRPCKSETPFCDPVPRKPLALGMPARTLFGRPTGSQAILL